MGSLDLKVFLVITLQHVDKQNDKVITIGTPHLRWQGPNNFLPYCTEMVKLPSNTTSVVKWCDDSISKDIY